MLGEVFGNLRAAEIEILDSLDVDRSVEGASDL